MYSLSCFSASPSSKPDSFNLFKSVVALAELRAETSLEKQQMANEARERLARMKNRGGNGASNR